MPSKILMGEDERLGWLGIVHDLKMTRYLREGGKIRVHSKRTGLDLTQPCRAPLSQKS